MTSDGLNWREDNLFAEARAAFPGISAQQALAKFLDTPTGKARHREVRHTEALVRQDAPADTWDAGIVYEAQRSGLSLEAFLKTPKGVALYRARDNFLKGRSRAKRR